MSRGDSEESQQVIMFFEFWMICVTLHWLIGIMLSWVNIVWAILLCNIQRQSGKGGTVVGTWGPLSQKDALYCHCPLIKGATIIFTLLASCYQVGLLGPKESFGELALLFERLWKTRTTAIFIIFVKIIASPSNHHHHCQHRHRQSHHCNNRKTSRCHRDCRWASQLSNDV